MELEKSEKLSLAFLLPVWGKSYITSFFDFSLRSLLAPGNIPAMSQDCCCSFVFLSKKEDIEIFKAQSTYQQLASYCQIEFIDITDLIFEESHSATLTLAYERGMRSFGKNMCGTYFFFLVSDYIMANGSLKNIKNYLKEGFSGLTTGNFLVIEENIVPLLKEKIANDSGGILSLESQELLTLGFPHLHPVTQAQIVNQGLTHATHANRLFWKVNEQIMVGRFYLRHMFCIKPEIDHFLIGASCDYSFISEMCPSRNVAHIQDSDLFCLIEMAPYNYERKWIAPEGYHISTLAHQLSQWTTSEHRSNAYIPVIYHATPLAHISHKFSGNSNTLPSDLDSQHSKAVLLEHCPCHIESQSQLTEDRFPPKICEKCGLDSPLAILQESEAFIRSIESTLSPTPQSVRPHPYWIACIRDIFHRVLQKKKQDHSYKNGLLAEILSSPTFAHIFNHCKDDRQFLTISRPKKRKRYQHQKILSGRPFQTHFWHPYWNNDIRIKNDVKKKVSQYKNTVVIAFESIPEEIHWLEKHFPGRCTYYLYDCLVSRKPEVLENLLKEKNQVLIWLRDGFHYELATLLRLILRYLPRVAPISIYLRHQQPYPKKIAKQLISICCADLLNFQIVYEIEPYSDLPFQALAQAYHHCNHRAFYEKSIFTRMSGYLGLGLLLWVSTFFNLLGRLGIKFTKKVTGATVVLRRSSEYTR